MIAGYRFQRLRQLAVWLLAMILLGIVPVMNLMPAATAGMAVNIDKELLLLRDGRVQIHISGARYRFAVFTYEDPDETGLGNALATIISHDLLVNSKLSSLGVLRYLGDLGKAGDERQLRYFDKVEPLIESQGVQVAIWGMIRRTESGIRIDSYVQLSPSVMEDAFSFTFRPPREIGNTPLVHRIGPDRLLAQRRTFTEAETLDLVAAAKRLAKLRTEPRDNAPLASELPLDKVYYLVERRGDWIKVAFQGGKPGWLRTSGFCPGAVCNPLVDVSQFATDLMAYDERDSRIPQHRASLTDDARVFLDQLIAVDVLNRAPPRYAEAEVLSILKPWCDPQAGVPSPGGGATCNLRALAQIIGPARARAAEGDYRPLERERIRAITRQLAMDSLSDPRHVPILSNLAILYSWLGDSERSRLAAQLAESARDQTAQ
jgi:hypothetical protein